MGDSPPGRQYTTYEQATPNLNNREGPAHAPLHIAASQWHSHHFPHLTVEFVDLAHSSLNLAFNEVVEAFIPFHT